MTDATPGEQRPRASGGGSLKATGGDAGRKTLECEGRIAVDGHICGLWDRVRRNPDEEGDV